VLCVEAAQGEDLTLAVSLPAITDDSIRNIYLIAKFSKGKMARLAGRGLKFYTPANPTTRPFIVKRNHQPPVMKK